MDVVFRGSMRTTFLPAASAASIMLPPPPRQPAGDINSYAPPSMGHMTHHEVSTLTGAASGARRPPAPPNDSERVAQRRAKAYDAVVEGLSRTDLDSEGRYRIVLRSVCGLFFKGACKAPVDSCHRSHVDRDTFLGLGATAAELRKFHDSVAQSVSRPSA